jgi:hypothetical protein
MAQPLVIALPPGLSLWAGCQVAVTALDPATGADLPAVQITNVNLEIDLTAGLPDDLGAGPFMLVPGPGG